MTAALTFSGPHPTGYAALLILAFAAGWAWLAVKEWRG